MIIVSTDGSCLRNPGGAIGWAWVNHGGGSGSGGGPSGTNQIAELRAVLEAILAHNGSEPLLIESDSLYAIKCASEWIHGWRNNGWRTSSGGDVKNLELIQQIDRAIAGRPGPVRFRWVRGHVGNYFNEQADKLAGQAARQVGGTGDEPGTPKGAKTTAVAGARTGTAKGAKSGGSKGAKSGTASSRKPKTSAARASSDEPDPVYDPITEPIRVDPITEPLPVTAPVESAVVGAHTVRVAEAAEKTTAEKTPAATTHSAPKTPRRRAAAKTPAPDALTLF